MTDNTLVSIDPCPPWASNTHRSSSRSCLCALALGAALTTGCNLEAANPTPTGLVTPDGGTDDETPDGGPSDETPDSPADAGRHEDAPADMDSGADANVSTTDAGAGSEQTDEAHGFLVVNTDYESVSVSAVDFDGQVLSPSLISSASADVGLSEPLSSDLVLPSTPAQGGSAVLIDRKQAVLSWLQVESGEVTAQLQVGTGFQSNPHDYLELGPTRAYVSRWEPNFDGGKEEYDGGDDVLIVNPKTQALVGRIDLHAAIEDESSAFLVRPEHLLPFGAFVALTAAVIDETFANIATGRVLLLDPATNELKQTLVLEGVSNCVSAALSPNGQTLAVSCGGPWGVDPEEGFPESAIVLLGLEDESLVEVDRFAAQDLGGAKLNELAWATPEHLLFSTYGASDDKGLVSPDTVRLLDIAQGKLVGKALLKTREQAYSLGAVACHEQSCVAADAEDGVLHHFTFDADGQVAKQLELSLDQTTGLPPRYLGVF